MNKFKENINYLLNNSKESQKQIAKKINLSPQKLTNLKSGYNQPTLDDLINIAKFFNVTTDYLLGLEDEQSISQNSNTTIKNSFNFNSFNHKK